MRQPPQAGAPETQNLSWQGRVGKGAERPAQAFIGYGLLSVEIDQILDSQEPQSYLDLECRESF